MEEVTLHIPMSKSNIFAEKYEESYLPKVLVVIYNRLFNNRLNRIKIDRDKSICNYPVNNY